MTARTAKYRKSALAFLVICGLSGGLTLLAGTDAAAKRPPGKYNGSFATFAENYSPPSKIKCKYRESWQGMNVEEYLCTPPVGGSAMWFLDQILAADQDRPSPNPKYDGKGWEYLAAPKNFECLTSAMPPNRKADTYTCAYKHRHKDGSWHTHTRKLSDSVLSTTDSGVDKWYLQHKPFPTP